MVLKVLLRFEPTVPITVTAATAINAAIRPYSTAVAPRSSLSSLARRAHMFSALAVTLLMISAPCFKK